MESRKKSRSIYQTAGYLAPAAGVLIWWIIGEKDVRQLCTKLIMTLIISGLYVLQLRMDNMTEQRACRYPILACALFCLSFLLLGMYAYLPIGAMWLLAIPVTEAAKNEKTAHAVLMLLCVQYGILVLVQNQDFTLFVKYLIFGYLILILYRGLEGRKSFAYFLCIVTICDLILQIVAYEFQFAQIAKELPVFLWETGSGILLGVCCVISYLLFEEKEITEVHKEEIKTEQEVPQTEPITENDRIFLQSIIEPDFDLFVRLQHYSMPLLSHSMRISGLSEQAALFIGAEPLLAKAGGLYHEVGRIVDEEDYIEAGTKLAKQYRFPKALVHVMRQHSTGFEKPGSQEAAIVMLSDCIISTSDYLQDTGKREAVSDERLVGSIFQNRMDKGNLDEAGFSKEQIEQLKDFYIHNAF